MHRLVSMLALSLAAAGMTTPMLAADFSQFGQMRGSYEGEDDYSPLGFEAGLRYWYSMGSQNFAVAGDSLKSQETTHILEAHLRIDDASTRTFVKGLAGYSVAINGTREVTFGQGLYSDAGSVVDGRIGYAGADFGYTVLGDSDGGVGIAAIAGYHFWHDSPNLGRAEFTTATSVSDVTWSSSSGDWGLVGFDSESNSIDVHALRLGLSGRAELGDFFDIEAEVAAVPYAWVNGILGAHAYYNSGPGYSQISATATGFSGHAYGAMAQAMVGISPTENFAFRVGGRAWYLQGNMDATFDVATITHPVSTGPGGPYTGPGFSRAGVISTSNPFSLFRYGLLAELTYKF